jgi:hypothetical protein
MQKFKNELQNGRRFGIVFLVQTLTGGRVRILK